MAISLSAATTWACASCRERFRPSGPRAGRVRHVGRSPDGAFHFSSLQRRLRRDPPPRDRQAQRAAKRGRCGEIGTAERGTAMRIGSFQRLKSIDALGAPLTIRISTGSCGRAERA